MNVPAWTTEAVPRAKHLLHAVGLEPRRSTTLLSISSWSWFGAGLVVGAGLALLLTQGAGLGAASSRGDGHDTPGGA